MSRKSTTYVPFAVVLLVVGTTVWFRWNGAHSNRAVSPEITLRLTPADPAAFEEYILKPSVLEPVVAEMHPFVAEMSEAELRVRLHQSLKVDSAPDAAEPGVVLLRSSFPSPAISVAFLSRLCDRIARAKRVHELAVKDLSGRRDSFALQLARIEKQIAKQKQFVSAPEPRTKQRWSDLTDLVLQAAAETEIDLNAAAKALKQLPEPSATDPDSFLTVQRCLVKFMDADWYEHGRFVKSQAQIAFEKAIRVRERLKTLQATKGMQDQTVLALQAELRDLESSHSQTHWMEHIVASGQSESLKAIVDFLDLLNAKAADLHTDPASRGRENLKAMAGKLRRELDVLSKQLAELRADRPDFEIEKLKGPASSRLRGEQREIYLELRSRYPGLPEFNKS